ncbi:MAG TPA: VOC family protein [Acidimicrobiales bacterium]|nr:VOC family protein [Acidimicrobiales bacterium]
MDRERTVLGIGAFARLSGISIPRLRRYHEAGLLVPADVDASSGYRTYRRAQLAQARELSRLRRADVPLQDLAAAMSADPSVRLGVLLAHRRMLEDRLVAGQRMIELVDQLIREERVSSTSESLQPMEVIIRVADVERTIGFYRDVLGFDFQPSDHEDAPLHYNATGGAWDPEGFFLFTVFPAGEWTTRAEFGFQVDDVDEVWARAKTHPGAQLRPPKDSDHVPRNATIADPDGNRINLYQRFAESLATFEPHPK